MDFMDNRNEILFIIRIMCHNEFSDYDNDCDIWVIRRIYIMAIFEKVFDENIFIFANYYIIYRYIQIISKIKTSDSFKKVKILDRI